MLAWFAENPWAVWSLAFLALAVIEMFSLELVCLMMAGGAAAAAIASVMTDNWVIQVLVFAVVALLLLFLVRPSLVARLHRNVPETRNNADALVGQRVEILRTVTDLDGLVRLAGDTWSARTTAPEDLRTGSFARVVHIDGATAVVESDR